MWPVDSQLGRLTPVLLADDFLAIEHSRSLNFVVDKRQRQDDGEQDDRRNNRRPRGRRDDRNDDRGEDQQDREQTMSRDDEDEGDNPFVRPRRGTEDRKSAPARRPRKPRNASANGDADGEQANGGMAGIDSSVLPPAIGDAGDSGDAEAAPAKPAPRRRRKTSSDSEAAEAVN